MSSLPDPPTTAMDLAVLRSLIGWGGADAARTWDRLGAGWRERLEAFGEEVEEEPEGARASLRRAHAAGARPDPAHVHPSWWIRALKGESPAVVRAVAAHAPPAMAEVLRRDLFLDAEDLRPDRPPHPEALQWALALWTERFVGGPAALPEDPPVIAALTGLGPHELYRLVHVTGLAKRSYGLKTPQAGDPHPPGPRDLVRLARFRRLWGRKDPRLDRIANWDMDETADVVDQMLSPLGLITVGRLLAVVEPHRTRWVLQHLPYAVARWLRPRITLKNPFVRRRTLLDWEMQIFQAAVDDLRDEGRPVGDEGDLV